MTEVVVAHEVEELPQDLKRPTPNLMPKQRRGMGKARQAVESYTGYNKDQHALPIPALGPVKADSEIDVLAQSVYMTLVVIASETNQAWCNPGAALIAQESKISEPSVRGCIERLEKRNHVKVIRWPGGRKSGVYWLPHLGKVRKLQESSVPRNLREDGQVRTAPW